MQKICNKGDEEGGYDQQKHGQSRYIGALVIYISLPIMCPWGRGGATPRPSVLCVLFLVARKL